MTRTAPPPPGSDELPAEPDQQPAPARSRAAWLVPLVLAVAVGLALAVVQLTSPRPPVEPAPSTPPATPSPSPGPVVSDGVHGPEALTLGGGPWTTRPLAENLSGSSASLAGPGFAELAFRGTGIAWVTGTNDYSGIADVYLDGRAQSGVDLYSARQLHRQTVYAASGLRPGVHTLKVVWTGTKNELSVGRNLTVDAFRVGEPDLPSPPAGLTTRVDARGATLTWSAGHGQDVTGYRVYRQQGPSKVLLGTTGRGTTRFLDAGLADATTYRYTVLAEDGSGRRSPAAAVSVTTPPPAPDPHRAARCPQPTVTVADRAQLLDALDGAGPGTVVRLLPGGYGSSVVVTVRGSADRPVWLCGTADAVFDQGSTASGVGLRVESSSHLVVAGMTVRDVAKGVTVTASDHVTLADLTIADTGEEAVHLKGSTTDSTLVGSTILRTGLVNPQYGEGVYLGTDKSNWCKFNGCRPDRTVRNRVVANTITRTAAEGIEAKEATADTVIADNVVDGSPTDRPHAPAELVKVKGNRFVVRDNTLSGSTLDGVLVLKTLDDTGRDNVVVGNHFAGGIPGYGVRVARGTAGTVVGCDNTGAEGVRRSNVGCQP